jgi:hypothetical protein
MCCNTIGLCLFVVLTDSLACSWRFFADITNDVGMALELVAPSLPSMFVPILCTASIMRVRVSPDSGSLSELTLGLESRFAVLLLVHLALRCRITLHADPITPVSC